MTSSQRSGRASVRVWLGRSNGAPLSLVQHCMRELGWRVAGPLIPVRSCEVLWYGPLHGGSALLSDEHVLEMGPEQRLNKILGISSLLKKIEFTRAVRRAALLCDGEIAAKVNPFFSYPRSWVLPLETALLQSASDGVRTFIVKPDGGSEGRRILLTQSLDAVLAHAAECSIARGGGTAERVVCQEYAENPLCIDGKKFDLRLYCLITSVHPLRAYLCREGLVRVCTEDYEPPPSGACEQGARWGGLTESADESFVRRHLTNYSLNKTSAKYEHLADQMGERVGTRGSKRSLAAFFEQHLTPSLGKRAVESLWDSCKVATWAALCALEPLLAQTYVECFGGGGGGGGGESCGGEFRTFQVIGFDVMVTDELRVVLLEGNSHPSMSTDFRPNPPSGTQTVGKDARSQAENAEAFRSRPSAVDHAVKLAVTLGSMKIARAEPLDNGDFDDLGTSYERIGARDSSDTDGLLSRLASIQERARDAFDRVACSQLASRRPAAHSAVTAKKSSRGAATPQRKRNRVARVLREPVFRRWASAIGLKTNGDHLLDACCALLERDQNQIQHPPVAFSRSFYGDKISVLFRSLAMAWGRTTEHGIPGAGVRGHHDLALDLGSFLDTVLLVARARHEIRAEETSLFAEFEAVVAATEAALSQNDVTA